MTTWTNLEGIGWTINTIKKPGDSWGRSNSNDRQWKIDDDDDDDDDE